MPKFAGDTRQRSPGKKLEQKGIWRGAAHSADDMFIYQSPEMSRHVAQSKAWQQNCVKPDIQFYWFSKVRPQCRKLLQEQHASSLQQEQQWGNVAPGERLQFDSLNLALTGQFHIPEASSPGRKPSIPIWQKTGCVPETIWPSPWIKPRFLGRPTRSQFTIALSYPDSEQDSVLGVQVQGYC